MVMTEIMLMLWQRVDDKQADIACVDNFKVKKQFKKMEVLPFLVCEIK